MPLASGSRGARKIQPSASRLPEIALRELPRHIHRALVRPRWIEQRAHLAHVLLEDGLATLVPERLQDLAQTHHGKTWVVLELTVDLIRERIELRRSPRPRVLRRVSALDRAADGLALDAEASRELADRDLVDEVQPPDLCPLLHVQHTLPSWLVVCSPVARLDFPDGLCPRRGGSLFERRQRGSIQATLTSFTFHVVCATGLSMSRTTPS